MSVAGSMTRTGDTCAVRMVIPDGRWRVEEIRVERGGPTLTRLGVTTYGGVFVAEVADVDQGRARRTAGRAG